MQSRFMSSSEPNLQRLFSQKSFEESLQVLTQLSLADESTTTEEANSSSEEICWDEVAQDLESFLFQGLDGQEVTMGDASESEVTPDFESESISPATSLPVTEQTTQLGDSSQ
jgi:hypothetical protein